jgi:Uma2 family endonuclease
MLIVEGYKIHLNKNPKEFTDDELYEFCAINKGLRIERDKNQNIIIMAPVGGKSGFFEKDVIFEVESWVRSTGRGYSFSSSTGFLLPSGAMRSPDACWVSEERWGQLTEEQKQKFPPVVPDFVVEIRSQTDALKGVQSKMEEWIENGVRLGWLLDMKHKQAFIYRANGSVEQVDGFNQILSGEGVMPEFKLDLTRLQQP